MDKYIYTAEKNIGSEHTYERSLVERLETVLSNPDIFANCLSSYTDAFFGMGFDSPGLHAKFVLNELGFGSGSLRERERKIWGYFDGLSIGNLSVADHIDKLVTERRLTMLKQISPYLLPGATTADFGAGNGEFMRLLVESKNPSLSVEGWDVVSDDKLGQVKPYDGRTVPRPDNYYAQVYATTVLHHMEDPVLGAREIVRLSSNRIILIETIAGVRTGDVQKDRDITFVSDYLWRLLHKSTEPVPGSYLTIEEWKQLFSELGCSLFAFEDFGNDQKTMTEKHVLFVFDKIQTL